MNELFKESLAQHFVQIELNDIDTPREEWGFLKHNFNDIKDMISGTALLVQFIFDLSVLIFVYFILKYSKLKL